MIRDYEVGDFLSKMDYCYNGQISDFASYTCKAHSEHFLHLTHSVITRKQVGIITPKLLFWYSSDGGYV